MAGAALPLDGALERRCVPQRGTAQRAEVRELPGERIGTRDPIQVVGTPRVARARLEVRGVAQLGVGGGEKPLGDRRKELA